MKRHSFLTILISLLLSEYLAFGTLTATVSPGYVFSPGEQPTLQTLNLLGEPSIVISGTVDGTTGLTPGSVNGALLADSVVDGITLHYNAASPRQIYVLCTGLVNTNSGIVAAANNSLQLLIDTNLFALATNSPANTNTTMGLGTNFLTLASAASGGGIVDSVVSSNAAISSYKIYCPSNYLVLGGSNNTLTPLMYDNRTLAIQTYTNVVITTNSIGPTNIVVTITNVGPALVEIAYSASVYGLGGITVTNTGGGGFFNNLVYATNGAYITVANPYNAIPSTLRWVLVCSTNNNGYVVGDELDVNSVKAGNYPEFLYGAATTNVWLTVAAAQGYFANKTNGATATFPNIDWSAKVYLKP